MTMVRMRCLLDVDTQHVLWELRSVHMQGVQLLRVGRHLWHPDCFISRSVTLSSAILICCLLYVLHGYSSYLSLQYLHGPFCTLGGPDLARGPSFEYLWCIGSVILLVDWLIDWFISLSDLQKTAAWHVILLALIYRFIVRYSKN